MSPNYYMVFAALATQSVAAFAPSTMRLRGTARAMPPDEGDGWSLLTTFENTAWHLGQHQLETATDLRSEPLGSVEQVVSAVGSSKNSTGKSTPQAPKSLSSILNVAVDSDGDLDDADVVDFLREGSLAGFA
ncbi:unnamed protein product [Symbiodinium necroappetens]|uniref:Uncharacterized protein n=2 Tax=Symbiodinium TaxID=2949 RepID=A0A812SVY6_9DINO|nr:hypothetical protein AK812_SmicGene16570 [Symbiodinium microadriaticum]CAE7370749.1 unnamed protein product [Symbiodinium sp. KB8]CAE7493874.1 unnamed protein product [Symbiodinium necroappetens]